jgi:hypothetical protein
MRSARPPLGWVVNKNQSGSVQKSTGGESQIAVHIRLHRFAVLDALVESYLRCK